MSWAYFVMLVVIVILLNSIDGVLREMLKWHKDEPKRKRYGA